MPHKYEGNSDLREPETMSSTALSVSVTKSEAAIDRGLSTLACAN